MDDPPLQHRLPGQARQRHQARGRRRAMAYRRTDRQRFDLRLLDFLKKPYRFSPLAGAGMFLIGVVLVLFILTYLLTGRIFPNVWALGISIGDMTVAEAETALREVWYSPLQIELVDGDRTWLVTPDELGLLLDTRDMAAAARGVGLAGLPFGYRIAPAIGVDAGRVQDYLAGLAEQVDIAPVNAGYAWREGLLTGLAGQSGRQLDVLATTQQIIRNPASIIDRHELELIVTQTAPTVNDPTPYSEEAELLIRQPFEMHGYDPFTDKHTLWTTSSEVFASWLEASPAGLTLRETAFAPFVEALNDTLSAEGDTARYLDPMESAQLMREAISQGRNAAQFRLRYRPNTYEVISGDTGFKIARKTGIPFFLLEATNPERDLSVLSPGDILSLPSRDVTVPLAPLPNKRIVVDLETQSLVAYEDGQEAFRWRVSSGIAEAPTSPGIYQIFNHESVAYGSSYTLCGETGCGQWEMRWFMGIYEAVPGLVNGFHGAVLLPDGTYLGGNNVGTPYTLGCVMSQDEQAKRLYDWADDGTIVEIISDEFAPRSDLARQVFG
jgi:hypothetical protein